MFGLGVVSSLANGVPVSIWLVSLFLLAKVFAFLYIVSWHDWTLDDLQGAAALVIGLAVILLALSALEATDPHAFRAFFLLPDRGVARVGLPTLQSLLVVPRPFAWFCSFSALFLFAGYVVYRRWWLLAMGAAMSVGTLLSARRRAIAGLAAGLVAGFARSFEREHPQASTRRWLPVGLASGAIVLAFLPALLGLIQFTGSESASGGADDARIVLYRTSVEIGRDYFPLGAGLGRYGSTLSKTSYSPIYHDYGLDQVRGLRPDDPAAATDTFWPRILGETGVFGLAALLLFTVLLTRQLWRAAAARAGHQPLIAAFLLGAWMVFIHGLVETLSSPLFDSPMTVYLLLGSAGVALALARQAPPNTHSG